MSMLPDNIPSSKSLIWGIAGEIIRKLPIQNPDPKKPPKTALEGLGILLAMAILFSIATAPFKILMRRNFGPKAISAGEIFLGFFFLVYSGAGLVAFSLRQIAKKDESDLKTLQNPYAMHYGVQVDAAHHWDTYWGVYQASVLFILAIVVLVIGLRAYFKAQRIDSDDWVVNNYRGDSVFFSKTVTSQKMRERVWYKFEPVACVVISFCSFFILGFVAFPLLFCSIAFAVNEYYHIKFKWEKLLTGNNTQALDANKKKNTQDNYVVEWDEEEDYEILPPDLDPISRAKRTTLEERNKSRS